MNYKRAPAAEEDVVPPHAWPVSSRLHSDQPGAGSIVLAPHCGFIGLPKGLLGMKDSLSSEACADRLKALADADRLKIVQVLRSGPKNVGEIASELAAEIANVSHHLQVLKRERIVQTQKRGRFVEYRLHPDVFEATRAAVDCLDLGCCKLQLPK